MKFIIIEIGQQESVISKDLEENKFMWQWWQQLWCDQVRLRYWNLKTNNGIYLFVTDVKLGLQKWLVQMNSFLKFIVF